MRTTIKLFGIAVLAMVIGFTMIACGDNGGGGIATKFRFRNQQPPANLNMSVARTAGPIEGTTVDTDSYGFLETYYAGLGSPVGEPITPVEFNVYDPIIGVSIAGAGTDYLSRNIGPSSVLIDFVQGTTISMPNDIPEGITATGILIRYGYHSFLMDGVLHGSPTITFTIASPLHEAHPWRTIPPMEFLGHNLDGWTNNDTTIKVPTTYLFPNPNAPLYRR